MAELLAKKKETKLLPSITDGRLGYLEINEDKMRFNDAMKGEKAIGGNEGMTTTIAHIVLLLGAESCLASNHLCPCPPQPSPLAHTGWLAIINPTVQVGIFQPLNLPDFVLVSPPSKLVQL